MTIVNLYLRLIWAKLGGDDMQVLLLLKEITMADFTALDAAIDKVAAKVAADAQTVADAQAALATAQTDAANLQAEIDARTAKLAAVAP